MSVYNPFPFFLTVTQAQHASTCNHSLFLYVREQVCAISPVMTHALFALHFETDAAKSLSGGRTMNYSISKNKAKVVNMYLHRTNVPSSALSSSRPGKNVYFPAS